MKQNNYLILALIGGGLWWWYKHKASVTDQTIAPVALPTITTIQPYGSSISLALPETTGVAQLVPTPATIMDTQVSTQNKICNCCAGSTGKTPHAI